VKLNVLKRNQPNQKIDLGKEVLDFNHSETIFLIGRSKECHIILDDKQVSREHVRIIRKNGIWFAEKTNDDNICLLNGESFNREEIKDGDVLSIAYFTIEVENKESELNNSQISNTNSINVEKEKNEYSLDKKFNITTDVVEVKPVENISKQIQVKEQLQQMKESLIDESSEVSFEFEGTSDIDSSALAKSTFESEPTEDNSKISNDDFEFSDNNESEAELALTQNNLQNEVTENNDLISTESEENGSYSLENIDSSEEQEKTRVFQSFAKYQLELFGETAPYDKFLIEKEKTFIGRDPSKCQIVLNDTEVSTIHAVITKNNSKLTIEDLKSSNGTILNGDRINKAPLNQNDEFVIGGVSFTVKVISDYLKEENATLMAVDENQTVEVEEFVEVQAEAGESFDALGQVIDKEPEEKSILKRIWKDEEKRKKLIYLVVILVGAWVLFGDDSSKAPTKVVKSKKAATPNDKVASKGSGKVLSDEEKRALTARFELGKSQYFKGFYREALDEFQRIYAVDPNFKETLQSLIANSKEGLSKLEEQEKKRLLEQSSAEKKIKIRDLLIKATEYVKDHRAEMAQDIFNDITKLDPENIEVTRLKMELDDWLKEKAKKELEEASKKKVREDKVDKLKAGKTLFIQKEWYKAIGKLDDFLKIKNMDEDLTKEASEMLKTSKDEISTAVAPLTGKAKSLMEGQDLKGAYEVYQQILKIEPSNVEALNSSGDIREILTTKARKIYREAIISESLSLFQDAKEKFQEVQQISPVDSNYYKKATDKLKDYLD
jgi:pSer/pThr/pTyr-binding forkhead associated (FHA) protein